MSEQKTIFITGATDGIGKLTAEKLVLLGHKVIIHGRSAEKLAQVQAELSSLSTISEVESYRADLSNLNDVGNLAEAVMRKHNNIDVLINNAGVLKSPNPVTKEGLDLRYVVNTLAPYYLTKKLLPSMNSRGRIINLSSAAQAPVDLQALLGQVKLNDFDAYAQSKLAITMWSRQMAHEQGEKGPVVIAVNPGSLLGSKMVKEGFNTEGKDLNIGADILVKLSLNEEHLNDSGKYFDNDSGRFSPPHPDGENAQKIGEVVSTIERILSEFYTL